MSWAAWRRYKLPGWYLWQFFAGFCLIANGAYIGVGAIVPVGDSSDLLQHGAHRWQFAAFGALTLPSGLWLWNGLGAHFGLASSGPKVSRAAAYVSLGLLLLLILIELTVGSR